ncbi:MAG: hypothetical protein WCJ40_16355 [Planctomycetota bacterium]
MNAPEKKPANPPEHLHEHAIETHMHNPDADRTALERWVRHKLTGGPVAWGPWLGGFLLVIVAIAFLSQGGSDGKAGEGAWTKLLTAQSAVEYVQIADDANTGSGAAWASLLAANQYYNQAINSLLVSRETVELNLGKAKDAYEKTIARATGVNDSDLANHAQLGLARTLEMQGKLTEAIEGYQKVATAAANNPIGKKAAGYAEALQKPDAKAFYQALATYKPQPPVNSLGSGLGGAGLGSGLGSGLDLPPNHPSLDGPTINTSLPALPNPGDLLKDLAPPPALSKPAASPSNDSLKDLAPPPATKSATPAVEQPKQPIAGEKPK